MGASASCKISGVNAASDTGWGHWIRISRAPAVNYTYTGSAVADGTPAPPPLTLGPLPKFGGTPTAPVGITFATLSPTITGGYGSTASATMQGTSSVSSGIFTIGFGCDLYVSTDTRAAAGGSATASASATDPWDVSIAHHPKRKSYILFTVTPDILLAPAVRKHPGAGKSGCRLLGSFGEISLGLDGAKKSPQFVANLNAGWRVFEGVHYPALGNYFPAPRNPLSAKALESLFVGQHLQNAPVWQWNQPAPSLTFVKEVPPSIVAERIEIGIGVDDADADDEEDDRDDTRSRKARG